MLGQFQAAQNDDKRMVRGLVSMIRDNASGADTRIWRIGLIRERMSERRKFAHAYNSRHNLSS